MTMVKFKSKLYFSISSHPVAILKATSRNLLFQASFDLIWPSLFHKKIT